MNSPESDHPQHEQPALVTATQETGLDREKGGCGHTTCPKEELLRKYRARQNSQTSQPGASAPPGR